MRVREAARGDVEAIVRMLVDDELGRQRERLEVPLPDSYWRAFDAIDRDPNNLLVVMEEDDEVVGTLQLTFLPGLSFRGGWRAQIEAVRVAAGHRGRGLGRQLLEWAIGQARHRGCSLVQLTTNRQREQARRFYESLGFSATHHGMKLYLRETS